jgi:ribose/xylose/arabinose/galactoside ABC-type transport system permease subunit
MNTRKYITTESVLAVFVLVLILVLSFTTNFGSRNGFYSFFLDVTPTMVAATALAMIIFTGNIDITAGTTSGYVAFVAGSLAKMGLPIYVFAPAGILVAMVLTGINGLITVKLKIHSLVVTLAMYMVHVGFYTFLPQSGWIENLGQNWIWFGRATIIDLIPLTFVVGLVVAGIVYFVSAYTSFGKALFAVGDNRQAAVYAGISPDRTVLKAFLAEGLVIGVAAILKATTRGEVMPSMFIGRELFYIAAALVGGVSIFGGIGKIYGAVIGAALVYLLSVTIIYVGLQDYYQFALQGAIILLAVYLSIIDFETVKKKFLGGGKPKELTAKEGQ